MHRGRGKVGGRAAAAAAIVGLLAAVPGCGPAFQEVLVVGHDANGTPVVGAVDCGFDDRIAAEVVSVRATAGSRPAREIWRVERPGTGRLVRPDGGEAPPAPEPRFIGGVEMVAIGDPRPPGGDAVVTIETPLPERVVVEAYTFVDDTEPIAAVALDASAAPGTYEVAFWDGGEVAGGLDADEAAERIAEGCAEDLGVDLAPVAFALAVTGLALVAVGVPIGIVTARQFRRAGASAAARRQAGAPPVS